MDKQEIVQRLENIADKLEYKLTWENMSEKDYQFVQQIAYDVYAIIGDLHNL